MPRRRPPLVVGGTTPRSSFSHPFPEVQNWAKILSDVIRRDRALYEKLRSLIKNPSVKPGSEGTTIAAQAKLLREAKAAANDVLDGKVSAKLPADGLEYIYEVFQMAIVKPFAELVLHSETFVHRVTPVTRAENISGALRQLKEQAAEVRYYPAPGVLDMVVQAATIKCQNFPTITARIAQKLPIKEQHELSAMFADIESQSQSMLAIMAPITPAITPAAPAMVQQARILDSRPTINQQMREANVTPVPAAGGQNKAVICRNYQRFGKCSYGDKCNFLHQPRATAMVAMAQMEPLDEEEMNMMTLQEHINQTGFEATQDLAKQVAIEALPTEDWTKEEN